MKESPAKKEEVKTSLFTEDADVISESDEDDSMLEYAAKVTTKKQTKFTFKKFLSVTSENSPGSLPSLPTSSPIVISSDELEKSMVELEKKVSIEMESD